MFAMRKRGTIIPPNGMIDTISRNELRLGRRKRGPYDGFLGV